MGPPEWNRQTEAKEEQGAQEAKAGGPSWPWPCPSARPLQPGPLYPPKKKSMGQLRGIRSPPGRNTLEKHDFGHSLVKHGRGQRFGLPRELEGAADGGLAFPTDGGMISRERRGRWAADGGVDWGSGKLAFPANGSQRAWVSGNPASLSQRQSGGLESAAIRRAWIRGRPAGNEAEAGRRALSQRRAGGLGLAVDGGVISCERWAGWAANGGVNSRERRDRWAANGGVNSRERRDGWAANGGVNSRELPRTAGWESRERWRKLPRTAGMRARGERTRLPRGTKHGNNQKTWKNEQNKTRWRDDAYCLVWSSVTVHTAGRNEEHADEEILQNNSL